MTVEAEASGVLVVRKHAGVTSHDIVGKVRRLFGTRQVGHTGTLDPMATGVLIVLIGRAVKASEYLSCEKKSYRATLRLGITTDTEDITGKVLSVSDQIPSFETVQNVLERFRGEIQQIPPMYSALKINGQKLVNLARQGKTIEREPRSVTVYSLTAASTETKSDIVLDVTCSGGTYIRTLCADIGQALGCGGTMASLCRTEAGGFPLALAHSMEELEGYSFAERMDCLLPVERLFEALYGLKLGAFYEKLIRGGCAVACKKLGCNFTLGARLRLISESDVFFALGEIVDSAEGPAVKAIKTFVL